MVAWATGAPRLEEWFAPLLGSKVELALVAWAQESWPQGHESGWPGPTPNLVKTGELVSWLTQFPCRSGSRALSQPTPASIPSKEHMKGLVLQIQSYRVSKTQGNSGTWEDFWWGSNMDGVEGARDLEPKQSLTTIVNKALWAKGYIAWHTVMQHHFHNEIFVAVSWSF